MDADCLVCDSIQATLETGGPELVTVVKELSKGEFHRLHGAVKGAVYASNPAKLFLFTPDQLKDLIEGVRRAN
jgi:hypothetical protein